MIKNYSFIVLVICLGFFATVRAQEIKVFTLKDFDLKDEVKTCLVSTKYGKEEYDFDKNGLLTKSVTRYNDNDYDVVYYKYKNDELAEKRSESYRDNVFDAGTSIAHFYELDTTANRKVTEKIVSYEKEFLDQYVYEYNEKGNLIKVIRTNNEGTDETLVEYKSYKGEHTITYLLNNVPFKSVRTSTKKKKDKSVQKIVLTKEYLKGEENNALETVFNADGKLIEQQEFEYDKKKKAFVPTTLTSYRYNTNGMLIEEITKGKDSTEKKEYIYQYDNGETGNWIKQIVTPDNTYTTRKISYYEADPVVEEE